ncbi:tail tip attachment protein J [Variovorax phage VarioGold]|uniref:host specificity factor TipJ family phage tail protein n=1 Tax=Variovorax sp. ZS18.2.2 TaxID=2971255 RepID=UPI0021512197|nr:host specificity factor TipJ family phage tail protein [Variovorax sp. ZS18.2.2]MCR6477519.1 host specificity factor TipJ family phage tail protein [Variovorax sp. ZS18.2.2]UYD72066.1 tail tip attachment protein J [Variovorax phage VarioGold]
MRVRVYEHPFAPCAPLVFYPSSLAEWLLEHYGAGPRGNVQIFAGEPSAETEISGNLDAILNANAADYVVLESPGEPATIASFLISVVLSVASAILFPPPDMPANVNRTQQSPNNALGSRENQVRLLQRVEDIYGTVKSVPSLMMPTYVKYQNNQRIEFGYYCVGRGYHTISEVKDGETPIASITGASAAVYPPFHSPNDGSAPQLQIGPAIIDAIVSVRRAVETDGFTLKAQNQIQLPSADNYVYAKAGVTRNVTTASGREIQIPGNAKDQILQLHARPNFNAISEVGQTVTISNLDEVYSIDGNAVVEGATRQYTDTTPEGAGLFTRLSPGDQVTISGFANAGNNGTFTVDTKPASHIITVTSGSQVDEVGFPFPIGVHVDGVVHHPGYAGTRTITEVNDQVLVLDGATFPDDHGYSPELLTTVIVNNGLVDWTDWIVQPAVDRTQVWTNVVAAQGLFADNGGRSPLSVSYQMQIEQLDADLNPTGNIETVSSTMTGATTDERGETLERVTGWVGPARVRMRRTTPYLYDFQGTIVDEIKWADLYSVSPITKPHFGNKTTIHTVTRATPRATAVRNRQLNCIASRLLPRWTGSGFSGAFDADGRHVSGTLEATGFLHDVIAAVALDPKIGSRTLAELDMVQMSAQVDLAYAIHPELPTFNYTFDSENTSLEETIQTIANAGTCIAYRQSGRIRLAFDRAQPASTALFTHRNKRPDAETITRTFANDADYDGVEFIYQDPETQQAETIRLPLDGSHTKLKKFEIPGIRSYPQAWLRACREYQKLIGQRISIETETTTDARALLPNTRVDIVDNTRFRSFDGEVVGQSGLELTLSRDVEFAPTVNHSIVLMRRDGSLQSINVTAGLAANKVMLQSPPSESVVTEAGQEGIRTIFSFASDDARTAQAYLVQEIGVSDGQYIQIRAINYSPDYYAADLQPIPPKESVIN